MEQHQLNDTWVCWVHQGNNDWTINGYKKVFEFNTIEKYWALFNNITKLDQMFFIMRKGVDPIWESPKNRNGGVLTFTVPDMYVKKEFDRLSAALIGETLVLTDEVKDINGISFSPKRGVGLFKIWFTDYKRNSKTRYNFKFYSRIKIKPHSY